MSAVPQSDEPFGPRIGDEDGYWAATPEEPVASADDPDDLSITGDMSNAIWIGVAALLLGLGLTVGLSRRHARPKGSE